MDEVKNNEISLPNDVDPKLSTNSSSMPVQKDLQSVLPPSPASFRRKRGVGDIINFDGELHRIRKFTSKGDIILRCLTDVEVHDILKARRKMQDEAILKAKAAIEKEQEKSKILEFKRPVVSDVPVVNGVKPPAISREDIDG